MTTSEDNPLDWFYLAAERLRAADSVYQHEGITFSGIELLHEAVERYLKGYLIAKGWKLDRTHDLRQLVSEAFNYDQTFSRFNDWATCLTEQFWAQHYPGDDLTDVGSDYETLRQQAGELIALIRTSYV